LSRFLVNDVIGISPLKRRMIDAENDFRGVERAEQEQAG
jgi:hypothetical protein